MKNTSSLSISRQFAFFIGLLLFSCNGPETQEHEQEEEASISEESDRVTLTQRQFETSAMVLGGFEEYSFGSSMKINGTIDVPPEGRAEISNYYGGYVRNLSILTGQHVKKG
ncbi:MAG TPA: hypothetical protein VKX33_08360, partial [Cyclobacteriaceae bacterium]|nr:hypothetical protein [Cyclobacteriaceae bacterium]